MKFHDFPGEGKGKPHVSWTATALCAHEGIFNQRTGILHPFVIGQGHFRAISRIDNGGDGQ